MVHMFVLSRSRARSRRSASRPRGDSHMEGTGMINSKETNLGLAEGYADP